MYNPNRPLRWTFRQKRFRGEYLVDGNATQAAIRAGFSPKTAYSTGHDLLKHPDMRGAIEQARQAISDENCFTIVEKRALIKKTTLGHTKCPKCGAQVEIPQKVRPSEIPKLLSEDSRLASHYAPERQEITRYDGDRGAEDIKLLRQAQYDALEEVKRMVGSNGDSEASDRPD